MQKKSAILTSTRGFLIHTVKDLSTAQLNTVPAGFNNNIIWNMAHLVATFERIIYLRTGIAGSVESVFAEKYKNGTKPERPAGETEISSVKDSLISQLSQFDADYSQLKEVPYEGWKTSAGFEITSMDIAIDYLAFHEGMHTGCIIALKHLV